MLFLRLRECGHRRISSIDTDWKMLLQHKTRLRGEETPFAKSDISITYFV
jgi:hypothetical protein